MRASSAFCRFPEAMSSTMDVMSDGVCHVDHVPLDTVCVVAHPRANEESTIARMNENFFMGLYLEGVCNSKTVRGRMRHA